VSRIFNYGSELHLTCPVCGVVLPIADCFYVDMNTGKLVVDIKVVDDITTAHEQSHAPSRKRETQGDER
jgi:hypothetical protein